MMINKQEIFKEIESFLNKNHFGISSVDTDRPWGGFFVIEEKDASMFAKTFFPDNPINEGQKIIPKILLIEPGKKLSWQFHHRRAELWKLIEGEAGVIKSLTDHEGDIQNLHLNEVIKLEQGERHRLIGLNNWGAIAEIWMHTNPEHPSNEEDIVRLQDDFGRK